MKRIVLLVATISLMGYVRAQENTLEVYLAKAEQVLKMQGQAVKAIDFENNYVWAITDSFLIRLNKVDKSITYYSYPFTDEKGSSYIIKVDKNGVKWIAHTEERNGNSLYESYSSSIYSFDGNQWEKVQSLGFGQVRSLYVDKNNCIWIVKQGNSGLFKIEQDNFIQYTPENSGLLYDYVNKVVSDNDGNIWMLNYGNVDGIGWANDVALIKYDYAEDKWTSYPYGGDGPYFAPYIQIDNEGNPWFRPSSDVVQKFDVASNSWSEKIYTSPPNIISPLDTIEVEKDSWYVKEWPPKFYYTNKDSIAVYDGSDWSFYTSANSALQFGEVYQIATDSDGTTWIGTENGLVSFNENLPSIPVESVGIDNCPSGDLTEGDTHQLTSKVLPADASNQSIGWSSSEPSVLTVDANGLLTAVNAGTATITLTTLDGEFTSSCEVVVKPKPAQNSNWDVYLEGLKVKSVVFENDYVWGVTDSSLFRLNKLDSSTAFYPFPYYNGQMSSIIEIDENGVIWLLLTEYIKGGSINKSHFSRIYNFDGNQWEKVNLSGYGFNPSSMAIDNRNNKWITIGDTLYRITQDNIVQIIDEAPGLWNSFKVVSDKNGNIWVLKIAKSIAGAYLELLKYEGDNWISYYKRRDSEFNDYGMTTDRTGNLWLNGMEFMGLYVPSVPVIQKLDVESHSFSEPIRGDSMNSIYSNLHISRFEAIEGENKFWGTRRVDSQNKGIAVISDSDYNIYTTSNSELPSDTLYQIAIESNGTKWFCTAKGLASFNENLPSIPVESVGIENCPSGDLTEGDTLQLTATVLPADASNQSISWNSSEPSVLTVDENGLLSAVNAGTATITVTSNDGEFTSSCEITVIAAIDILTEVVIPDEIFPGDTITFYAKYETSQSRDIGASIQLNSEPWTNYGFNIRTVPAGTGTDSVNLIVPLDIPISDNAYKIVLGLLPVGGDLNESLYEIRIVDVSVVSKLIRVESVGIDNCPSGDLTLGDTHQLTVKVLPAYASNQSISWYSSEPSVLTVDENGLLSAVNAGTAYITVTTNDGGFISSCDINVVTSTDIKANAMKEIEIFPNPAGDYINIKLPEELKKPTVTILNIQGKKIKRISIDNNQSKLDVSHLPSGLYIVRIESKQNYILKKFIKQ